MKASDVKRWWVLPSDLEPPLEGEFGEIEIVRASDFDTYVKEAEAVKQERDALQSRLDEAVKALEAYMKKDPSDKIGVPECDESEEYKQATAALSKVKGVK